MWSGRRTARGFDGPAGVGTAYSYVGPLRTGAGACAHPRDCRASSTGRGGHGSMRDGCHTRHRRRIPGSFTPLATVRRSRRRRRARGPVRLRGMRSTRARGVRGVCAVPTGRREGAPPVSHSSRVDPCARGRGLRRDDPCGDDGVERARSTRCIRASRGPPRTGDRGSCHGVRRGRRASVASRDCHRADSRVLRCVATPRRGCVGTRGAPGDATVPERCAPASRACAEARAAAAGSGWTHRVRAPGQPRGCSHMRGRACRSRDRGRRHRHDGGDARGGCARAEGSRCGLVERGGHRRDLPQDLPRVGLASWSTAACSTLVTCRLPGRMRSPPSSSRRLPS